MLNEVERCCIQPLQIIEEQRERVLRPGEYAEEAPEHQLEAVLRVLRRQLRDRRLFPDYELQLGNEVHDELSIWAQRLAQRVPPVAKLGLALAQKRAHKALEGLCQGGVRDVALVLVELAGREQAARRYERLVQLVHHRGFADAGIAGHEHQFGRARGHDTVKGREQRIDLAHPAVKLLRDQQPIRYVVSAEWKRVDTTMRLPFDQAPPQIGLDARGGLVALLGGLGEKLHDNRSERPLDARDPLVERRRLPGDMAV